MRLAEAVEFVFTSGELGGQFSRSVHRALKDGRLAGDFRELLEELDRGADDYTTLKGGANTLVFGNGRDVVKFSLGDYDFEEDDFAVPVKDIPEGLAAKIYAEGEYNGIKYQKCEALDTSHKPMLEEVVPYLFRAADKGVIYWDPKSSNFAHNTQGELRAIDHEHFMRLDNPDQTLGSVLSMALDRHYTDIARPYPLILSDAQSTYVVFDPLLEDIKPEEKKLRDALKLVGIEDALEMVEGAPVARIRRREVTLGTPPEKLELADYLQESNTGDIRLTNAAQELVTTLRKTGVDFPQLPSARIIATMDSSDFLDMRIDLINHIDGSSLAREQLRPVDEAFNRYYIQAFLTNRNR